MHRLLFFFFLLCAAGKRLWQRQSLVALLLWCSPRAGSLGKRSPAVCSSPAATNHHAQKSSRCPCHTRFCPFWVFHVWTLVALLNTALRLSDPRVALRVGYFKLISCLPPSKISLMPYLFCLIFHHQCCMASFILIVAGATSAILMRFAFVLVYFFPACLTCPFSFLSQCFALRAGFCCLVCV